MSIFSVFGKVGTQRGREHIPETKYGDWLVHLEDIPDPINEQTDQLIRVMDKLRSIVEDLSQWEIADDSIAISKGNVRIEFSYDCGERGLPQYGKFYYGDMIIQVFVDDVRIEYLTVLHDHSVWCSSKRKLSREGIALGSILDAISAENRKRMEEKRKQFYGAT